MNRWLLALMAALSPLTGRAQHLGWAAVDRLIAAEYPDTPSLSTDSLAARMASAPDGMVLLDVREADEFAVSRLPGAVRVDPGADTLPAALAALPRNTPIVVYCSVGVRSAKLVERLREAGFTQAFNLKGSIFRWANEGRPLERDGRSVQTVHPYDRVWGRLLAPERRAYTPD